MGTKNQIISAERIREWIFTVRGMPVILDSDLATIYEVETKVFNQAVKRNEQRFPAKFRFQLSQHEYDSLRSQIVTLKNGTRGKPRKYLPYVFTEQGVAMLSAVLRSKTAINVSIKIMSAFVEMRRFIQTNADIFVRLNSVERRQIGFESETGKNFEKVFQALQSGEPPKQGIFFNGQIFDAYILKDLGKKWFAFSKIDSMVGDVLKRLKGSENA